MPIGKSTTITNSVEGEERIDHIYFTFIGSDPITFRDLSVAGCCPTGTSKCEKHPEKLKV